MPTPDDLEGLGITLPPEAQVRMAMQYYDKHMKEYEQLKNLIVLHETELAMLWGAVVVLGCVVAYQAFTQRSNKKEVVTYGPA